MLYVHRSEVASSSPSTCTPFILYSATVGYTSIWPAPAPHLSAQLLRLVTLYGQPQLPFHLHTSNSATVGYTIEPSPAVCMPHIVLVTLNLVTLDSHPQLPFCLQTSYSATVGYTIQPAPIPLSVCTPPIVLHLVTLAIPSSPSLCKPPIVLQLVTLFSQLQFPLSLIHI